MKIKQKALFLSLSIAIILTGCGDNKEKDNYPEIAKKTKEALGEKNNSSDLGCKGDSNENNECTQKDSSNYILSKLENKNNSDDELESKLNNLIEELSEEEKSSSNNKLEELVQEVIEKDSNDITKKGLEDLVDSFHKENNAKSIKNELISLVEEAESSKEKREKIESELLSLVNEAETQKNKKEEVKKKLLELVKDASKKKKTDLRQTRQNLEQLVKSAEKKGTKEAKRLANSILEDISKKKIKILKAEDKFVVIRVQVGDNLSDLALKYYGDAKKYKIIYNANKNKIKNGNIIYPGTTLVIPTNIKN